MVRVRLDTVLDLHSPSTIDTGRGYSMNVYLSAVQLGGVDLELIIITSTDNGPLLPDGSRVHAVGRAVRLGDVVLARNPTLTVKLDADDGQPTTLVASMRDLAISDDSDAATPVEVVSDGNNTVHMPEPLLLPGQTHLAGFEVLVIPDDPVINNWIRAYDRMVRSDIPRPVDVVSDGNNTVHMPEPLLLPGQTHLAGFEVLVVPDDPVINNWIRASERADSFAIL